MQKKSLNLHLDGKSLRILSLFGMNGFSKSYLIYYPQNIKYAVGHRSFLLKRNAIYVQLYIYLFSILATGTIILLLTTHSVSNA